MTDYQLYGNEMSFYTGKVRAYLNWKGLAYDEILPTREIFKTRLLPNVGRAIVPILETPDGEFIQGWSYLQSNGSLFLPCTTAGRTTATGPICSLARPRCPTPAKQNSTPRASRTPGSSKTGYPR